MPNHPELISFRRSLSMYFVLCEERRREKREEKEA
jgi:hypothetical protein